MLCLDVVNHRYSFALFFLSAKAIKAMETLAFGRSTAVASSKAMRFTAASTTAWTQANGSFLIVTMCVCVHEMSHFIRLTGWDVLFHGTPIGCVPSILMEGLLPSSAGASVSQALAVFRFK